MKPNPKKTPREKFGSADRLTGKQEAFAQAIADGHSQSDAYRQAYRSKAKTNTLNSEACRLAASSAIAARIAELKAATAAERGMTRVYKRAFLADVVAGRKKAEPTQLKAVEIDNVMTGDNAAVKVEGEITLFSILKDLEPSTGLPSSDAKRR